MKLLVIEGGRAAACPHTLPTGVTGLVVHGPGVQSVLEKAAVMNGIEVIESLELHKCDTHSQYVTRLLRNLPALRSLVIDGPLASSRPLKALAVGLCPLLESFNGEPVPPSLKEASKDVVTRIANIQAEILWSRDEAGARKCLEMLEDVVRKEEIRVAVDQHFRSVVKAFLDEDIHREW